MNDFSAMTATGINVLHENPEAADKYLRQHCLQLALQNQTGQNPKEQAKEFFDFIKGASSNPAPAPPDIVEPSIARCICALSNAFREDPAYAYSWQANLACAVMDEIGSEPVCHLLANKAAARFMKNLFGVETSADMLEQKTPPHPRPNSFEASVDLTGKNRSVCVSHERHAAQEAHEIHSVTIGFPTEADADAFGRAMMPK